jgi:Flp pilus assembly protein TadG
MPVTAHLRSLCGNWCRRASLDRLKSKLAGLGASDGQQLVEFAVSLPLLVVFVVGVFDFGSAFTTKLSFTGGDCTQLFAVCAVRDVVERSLVDAKINDCGLASATPTYTPNGASNLIWTFTVNNNCAGTLTLTVNRGFTYTANLSPPFSTNQYTIEATQVTLSYPYKWQFAKVIQFVSPGASFAGTSQITSVATMQNAN